MLLLDNIEKENPSVLRLLAEETIRRLHEYQYENRSISWLKGIESDFVCALNNWAEGCLNSREKRDNLKKAVHDVVSALKKFKLRERTPESLERIHELLVTINVINEALNYLNEIKGEEMLHALIQQVYDLKKVIEWKRAVLNGIKTVTREMIMTEEEKAAQTPESIARVLQKRMSLINKHLLTREGRKKIIDDYTEICEQEGFTRHRILEGGLAEVAEMMNKLEELMRSKTVTVTPRVATVVPFR